MTKSVWKRIKTINQRRKSGELPKEQRCWYTGVICKVIDPRNPPYSEVDRQQACTREHLVPLCSGVHNHMFNDQQRKRNAAWSTYFANNLMGALPLGFKLIYRERARRYMRGRDNFTRIDLAVLRLLHKDLLDEYSVKGIPVWASGDWFWRKGFTQDDFAPRTKLRNYLTLVENGYIKKRFYDEIGLGFTLPLRVPDRPLLAHEKVGHAAQISG